MTIEFELPYKERRQLHLWATKRAWHLYGPRWVTQVRWILLPASMVGLSLVFDRIDIFLLSFLVFASIDQATRFGWQNIYRRNELIGESPGFPTRYSISIKDEGLVVDTSMNETKYHWNALRRIEQLEKYLFVLLSPSLGFMIPKRAFSSPVEMERFIKMIEAKIQTAGKV
jgi:hypothetical protein